MNILEICQQACRRAKQPVINDLFLNDEQSLEYLGYAEMAANIIFTSNNWRQLVKDYEFTTDLDMGEQKQEYPLPDDFNSMLTYFLYDKTRQLTLENSDDDESLLNEMLRNQNRDWIKWRIVGSNIKFDRPIEEGRELEFSYKSKNFVKNIDNTGETPVITFSQLFANNDDEFLINDEVLVLGILWQRSLSLGFPDVNVREQQFMTKLSTLKDENKGLRRSNMFNQTGFKRISGTNYAPYPYEGDYC